MGINFPDGTQNHSGKLIQSVDNYYSTITSFSTHSNTLQRMWTFTFTPKMANSRIVHFAEFHGYYGSSGADNIKPARVIAPEAARSRRTSPRAVSILRTPRRPSS